MQYALVETKQESVPSMGHVRRFLCGWGYWDCNRWTHKPWRGSIRAGADASIILDIKILNLKDKLKGLLVVLCWWIDEQTKTTVQWTVWQRIRQVCVCVYILCIYLVCIKMYFLKYLFKYSLFRENLNTPNPQPTLRRLLAVKLWVHIPENRPTLDTHKYTLLSLYFFQNAQEIHYKL